MLSHSEQTWHNAADRVREVSKMSNLPITPALVAAVYPDASENVQNTIWFYLIPRARPLDPNDPWEANAQNVRAAHGVLQFFGLKVTMEDVVNKMFANASESTRGLILSLAA